ncbi:MAG TPA: fibronectin type III domain-containing protein [Rugosimonospora sp.]|nr:fibronectin type III domain-containing protein [Rugosimonospora sp.]
MAGVRILEDSAFLARGWVPGLIAVLLCATAGTAAPASAGTAGTGQAPRDLRVPALAYDAHSITLAWHKPPDPAGIVDYHVYRDGLLVGTAGRDATGPAHPYVQRFYADPANADQVRVATTNFTAQGLRARSTHRFMVRAVFADGRESPGSNVVTWSTTAEPRVLDVTAYGAVGDGVTVNTAAIQRAIDACPAGCTVRVPAGTFKTGAIWLHSDMTLEVARGATLLGSERASDYPYHYLLYPYSTDERFYSLINAHTWDYGSLRNIRIVGAGTIDGNGWKQTGVDPDGFPVYAKGSLATVASTGILAAAQVTRASALGSPAPYPTRSNLITLRGVDGVYLGGFTAVNPSNHTLVTVHSTGVTVDGVQVRTFNANNADGLEFIHGTGLTVLDSVFDTGDDCVNFAAGLGAASPAEGPSRDAWVFDNYFRHGHGAVVTGSHTGAWIADIVAEDNVVDGTDVALRMKTVPTNGGGARDVVFRDSAVRAVGNEAFVFTSDYSDPSAAVVVEPAATPALFEHVTVEHVTVDGTGGPAIHVVGVAAQPHRELHFIDVRFRNARPAAIDFLRDSSFRDVTFDQTADPWQVTDSSGLSFTGTTTADTATRDAAAAPRWPAGAVLAATAAEASVTLAWPAATDNVAVSRYRIRVDGQAVATTTATAYTVTGLAPALRYAVTVRAEDATGNSSGALAAAVTTTGVRDAVPPVAGGAFTVVAGGVGTTWAGLAWQPATDNYAVAGYRISANGRVVGAVDASTTRFVATGLRPGTAYTFALTAVDATGNATRYPATPTATTAPPYDTGAPTWPARHPPLTVRSVTQDSVTVGWPAARDDQRVIGYRVLVDGNPVGGDAPFTPINTTVTVAGTSFTVTGLAPGTRYAVAVEAGDAMGRWSGPHPMALVRTR